MQHGSKTNLLIEKVSNFCGIISLYQTLKTAGKSVKGISRSFDAFGAFLPRDAMQPSCGVCLSVRLSRLWILSKRINISSIFFISGRQTILVFLYWTSQQYSDGSVECRWGRQKSRFSANSWLHRVLCTLGAASAIHSGATDHGKLMTLATGKRRSLLMAGDDDEVCDKNSQRYAEHNRAAFSCTQW